MVTINALFNDNIHPEQDCDPRTYTPENTPPSKAPGRPRYKIDLAGQQAECEANYHRLCRLLPGIKDPAQDQVDGRDQWMFEIGAGPILGQVLVRAIDRAPYTTTLVITQEEQNNAWAKAPALTICMYHDVNMAEVVGWENHRRLRARYDYPNPDMYHSDEKAQLNQFLREWLTLCQCHGRSAIRMSELGIGK